MNAVLTGKSLAVELRRIAKVMKTAEIRQFSARDCDVLYGAAAVLDRKQDETSKPEGGA